MSLSDFQMNYEYSPITLVGGIADQMGGSLQILYLLQPELFPGGPTGSADLTQNQPLAHFYPEAGSRLIFNQSAEYTIANQQVAANAQIVQALPIALIMQCPAQTEGGYEAKLGMFQNLQSQLQQHTAKGGTYIVATPAMIWDNCLLDYIEDANGDGEAQAQVAWRWVFHQPLLTVAQAQQAQSTLLSKIGDGTQVNQDANGQVNWTDPSNPVNQPIQSSPNTATIPTAGVPPS